MGISIRKNKKILYLPTGIVGCSARITRDEYRKKYHIPEDAFVVSYVGRHNEIKGYADLKKMGEELLNNQNIYFLIAGKEEPMKGLDNSHWIEVGWTNAVYKPSIVLDEENNKFLLWYNGRTNHCEQIGMAMGEKNDTVFARL